jgi:hypothetical protein
MKDTIEAVMMSKGGIIPNARLIDKDTRRATNVETSNSKISAIEAFDQFIRCTPINPPIILKSTAKQNEAIIAFAHPMCIGLIERRIKPTNPKEEKTIRRSIVNQFINR